ncbi:MAG: RIP metalloprotease RseP [Succinivibrionaceae bacterium]
MILSSIFYFLIAIAILIAIHEAGHFIVARLCGVYIEKFSIGFGPQLFTHTAKNGTQYTISLIPLGGYVKMYGEKKDDENTDEQRVNESFIHKKVWQRFLIVFAGPFFNLILAYLLYSFTFMIGVEETKPILDVTFDSIAAKEGFKHKDLILSINDEDVLTWEEAAYAIVSNVKDENVEVFVKEDKGNGKLRKVKISLENLELDPEKQNFLQEIGLKPYFGNIKNEVNFVEKNSPADIAGFKKGDVVIAVAGENIESWTEFTSYIKDHPSVEFNVKVMRNNQAEVLVVKPAKKIIDNNLVIGYLGIAPLYEFDESIRFIRQYDFFSALYEGANKTLKMSVTTLKFIKKFITGDISYKNVSGPIGIAKGAGMTAELGFSVYLMFLAMISVNLGILNLLPIPILDGGHLFFYIIEGFLGKPVPEKIMNMLLYFGLVMLISLMMLGMFNDIMFNL